MAFAERKFQCPIGREACGAYAARQMRLIQREAVQCVRLLQPVIELIRRQSLDSSGTKLNFGPTVRAGEACTASFRDATWLPGPLRSPESSSAAASSRACSTSCRDTRDPSASIG